MGIPPIRIRLAPLRRMVNLPTKVPQQANRAQWISMKLLPKTNLI